MYKLLAHFTGGTSGYVSISDNLGELISEARKLVEDNQIKWMKMLDETNNIVLFELTAKEVVYYD
jgi:hypothetical protein